VPLSERFQLTKIEGQVWISLYELLMNPQCLSKYDYTEFKKNQIIKVNHLYLFRKLFKKKSKILFN
jgi:hypothetical protein